MQFVRLDDVTVHYRWTAGRKPALVLVNSLGTDLRMWREVAVRLDRDFSILSYDMRGHGLTETGRAPFCLARLAEDLAALMDHLRIGKATVCGVSLGGMVAQQLHASRPDLVARLVLSDTLPKIGDRTMWMARFAAIAEGGMAAVADAVLERWFSAAFRRARPADHAGFRAMLVRQPADGYSACCAALAEADLGAHAARIDVPTLCVVGDNDVSTTPAQVAAFARLIPDARYEQIDNCGHLPAIEQPQAFADLVRTFALRTETETVSHAGP